jgi:translation initiation factor IF-2
MLLLGLLSSMRHLKNEVDSIKKDVECGLRLEDGTIRFKPGDSLVCYEIKKEQQQTDWDPGF